MSIRVGIVGISGFGGGELLRLIACHPAFELVHAAGDSSAGRRLGALFPGLAGPLAERVIAPWEPAALPPLDLLFASLPTGASARALAQVAPGVKILDLGGDHRFAAGWAYGLADVWPDRVRGQTRVANPGCFPAAVLTALAPLLAARLIAPGSIVIDGKTGISGAGRGGDSRFAFAESNENLVPYGLLQHVHMPEMATAIADLGGGPAEGLVFTPHLVPMTRGILATIYCRGEATTEQCLAAARQFYAGRAFVRVSEAPPQTKWATGSNLAFISYAADPARKLVIAMGVVDNLEKGRPARRCRTPTFCAGWPRRRGWRGCRSGPERGRGGCGKRAA